MIVTVTTVRDTPSRVLSFCRRNLAAGADHMVIFLDEEDRALEAALSADPHITLLVPDRIPHYWTPNRPGLNIRQAINANVVNAALAGFEWAHWLVGIDADEVLEIDRDRLLGEVPAKRLVVRLRPLEAVRRTSWPGDEVTHFKELLPEDEIRALVAAGCIPAPDPGAHVNSTWFSGHLAGKVGVRPDLWIALSNHDARDRVREYRVMPSLSRPWLEHRHYESYTLDEFVRKWTAHLTAGPITLRGERRELFERFRAIATNGSLTEDQRSSAYLALFQSQVEDDLPTLLAQGRGRWLRAAASKEPHTPQPLPSDAGELFHRLLGMLTESDKSAFLPRQGGGPMPLFARLRESLPDNDPLQPVLRRAVRRAERRASRRLSSDEPPVAPPQ